MAVVPDVFVPPGTPAWHQMAANAERYGTKVACPDRWKREGNHYALATDVLPSAEWRGHESELGGFAVWNQALNAAWSQRYPPQVLEFRRKFYGG